MALNSVEKYEMTLDKLKVQREIQRELFIHLLHSEKEKFLERKQSYLKHAQSLTETTKSTKDNLPQPTQNILPILHVRITRTYFSRYARMQVLCGYCYILSLFGPNFCLFPLHLIALTLKVFITRESGPLCQDDICVTAQLTSSSILRQTSDITDCSCNVL